MKRMKRFVIGLVGLCTLLAAGSIKAASIETDLAGYIDVIVSQDGTGDYETLQAAIDAVPDDNADEIVIFLRNGSYYEKINIPWQKTNITLVGESVDSTIVHYDDNGNDMGSWGSVAFQADANNFTAINLTFQNSYDENDTWNLAFSSFGDKQLFYHCRFKAWQDTYYVNWRSRSYMKDCYIEGAIDFIYGYGIAVFDSCQVNTIRPSSDGVITASAASKYNRFGLTFTDSRLTTPTGASSFYLGRPWQGEPHVAYINCWEPSTLYAKGWTSMNEDRNPLFAEYNCYGPGYKPGSRSTAADYPGVQLTEAEAEKYLSVDTIFAAASFADPSEASLEADEMYKPFYDAYVENNDTSYVTLITSVMNSGRDTFPDIPTDDWMPRPDTNPFVKHIKANNMLFLDSVRTATAVIDSVYLNGERMTDFDVEVYQYVIELPEGDTAPAQIEVFSQNGYSKIVYPSTVPNQSTFYVYSADYVQKSTYKIFNSLDSVYWDADLTFLGYNKTDTIELEPGKYTYDVELAEGVTKVKSFQYNKSYSGSSVSKSLPSSIPGTGTVTVTAKSGDTKVYTVNFSSSTGISEIAAGTDKMELVSTIANKGLLYLSNPFNGEVVLKLYSISGKIVSEQYIAVNASAAKYDVDFSSLTKGVYLYQLANDTHICSGKVILTE